MGEYDIEIERAVNFLLRVQCSASDGDPGAGGFGHALSEPTQRIDVTGHVASAFLLLLELAEDS